MIIRPILLAAWMLVVVQGAVAEDIYVAFWNVENLFDTVDDPTVEKDEEFTPCPPVIDYGRSAKQRRGRIPPHRGIRP